MSARLFLMASAALAVSLGGCATLGRSGATVAAGCNDITFPIYFQEGSDALTAPAIEAIGTSARQAKACRILGVEVTGLADGAATAENLALSSRRATTVAGVLASNGLPSPSISLEAGASGARTSRNTRATPVRQPTEVVIRVAR